MLLRFSALLLAFGSSATTYAADALYLQCTLKESYGNSPPLIIEIYNDGIFLWSASRHNFIPFCSSEPGWERFDCNQIINDSQINFMYSFKYGKTAGKQKHIINRYDGSYSVSGFHNSFKDGKPFYSGSGGSCEKTTSPAFQPRKF